MIDEKTKLIEAGWTGFRATAIPKECPPGIVDDMHVAFFAGALHLFVSITRHMLNDRTSEITETDLPRLTQINNELAAFEQELLARQAPPI